MSESWPEEELRASVDAYVEMHRLEGNGKRFTKKAYYEALESRFGRTAKSYEYRMQNISYVYSLQGRRWISGLRPARNVGSNVIKTLERLIAASEGQQLGVKTDFDAGVERLRKSPPALPPSGNKNPALAQSTVTSFVRDPEVVAWVLDQAAGYCECCDAHAPFVREDDSPFLEVHHVQRLADGGGDTPSNAVALCPNCHRELHYGIEKRSLANKLQSKIGRLVPSNVNSP